MKTPSNSGEIHPSAVMSALPYSVLQSLSCISMTTTDGWLGTPEVAELLGVTQRTVYSFINSSGLAAYRLGRVIRLRESDVAAFLDRQRIHPGDLDHLG